jgi:putative DNA primase/helicase
MSARELAAQFGLHRSGRQWRGPCPACGYADAFVLADGNFGPIGWCASCGNREAIAEALGGGQHKAGVQLPRERDARDLQKRLDRAEKIWRGSEPVLGTPAANYLNVRGIGHLITCSELRFRADCPHPSGSLERLVRLPALVAAVRDADGRLVGVHRTYLKRDGSGKAEAEPQKASVGNVRGGAVRLSPLEHVLNVGELVLAEGIESAGSAAILLSLPAWAALSAGNLASGVILPAGIRKVAIAADRDAPDKQNRCAGQDAARAAWFRFRREGRAVRIAMPDEGRGDFNNILLARGAG